MNRKERVLTALNHQEPDRVPVDLSGSDASGITAIAYNNLKSYQIANSSVLAYHLLCSIF